MDPSCNKPVIAETSEKKKFKKFLKILSTSEGLKRGIELIPTGSWEKATAEIDILKCCGARKHSVAEMHHQGLNC